MAKRFRILAIVSIGLLLLAGLALYGCEFQGPGRVVGLTAREARNIQQVVVRFRWARLRRAATARSLRDMKSAIQEIAQGRVRETGALGQTARAQADAYLIAGSPSNTLYTYTLRPTTNSWAVVSSSYAR